MQRRELECPDKAIYPTSGRNRRRTKRLSRRMEHTRSLGELHHVPREFQGKQGERRGAILHSCLSLSNRSLQCRPRLFRQTRPARNLSPIVRLIAEKAFDAPRERR
jgi:hypothetical protein